MSEIAVAPRHSNHQQPSSCLGRASPLGAYTHLRRDESILVVDWERSGAHAFTLNIKWPAVQGGLPYDPRILAQTIRQSGLVIAHAEYDVPLNHQTVLNTLDITIPPGFRAPADRTSALRVELDVARPKRGWRNPNPLRVRLRILHGDVTVARVDSEFGWISPPAYRRLRGEYASATWDDRPVPAPVAPGLVGRHDTADVVLSPAVAPDRWLLRNVVANTLLFDHPVDHVPGLVLLEAAHQAAHALVAPAPFAPTRVSTRYARYVEFDRPCWIEAELLPAPAPDGLRVRVRGVQDGETAFTVDLDGKTR
ncbi:ScbA/BarX family gamma-butyrolactone biosynthesis protein [Streptomyces sp. NBC_01565]|uniref:ScbA/BarX family gamma-butyrolactone biosynthesis protein n=1 Tax=unclassified Streptomyces TaxID=2593676 RepID=UPI002254FE09|nr:ScbA/BarX family gamma-butyrolactone biosynthesis protein [Streptomyces sp. NBC_01565]MCX4543087.1 ScbA/BarX family gamma-butyrolactone biosynthesis protein [Streptomyces sp. NBC_01565]